MMVAFLRNLSLTGALIGLVCTIILTALAQRIVRHERLLFWFRSDDAVVNYVQMLTVFYGLLLGMVAVDLWAKQDEAENNATNEANEIRIVSDLARGIPGDRSVLITSLGDYAQGVIKKEWPMMLSHKQQEMFVASPELDNVRNAIMSLEPNSPAEQAAFREILNRYEDMVEARQRRLLDSERELPDLLRVTLIIGAIFTVVCTFFIESKHVHTQSLLAGVSGGYLFLLVYVILILEHPFEGSWRVGYTPYERVLEILH
jgi:hypothetical protein